MTSRRTLQEMRRQNAVVLHGLADPDRISFEVPDPKDRVIRRRSRSSTVVPGDKGECRELVWSKTVGMPPHDAEPPELFGAKLFV